MTTWFDLSRDAQPGTRVVFPEGWDVFPLCQVPPGATGTVTENGLNEIWGGLSIRPDDPKLQEALREWNGDLRLFLDLDPGSNDPEWNAAAPIEVLPHASRSA